MAKRSAVVKRSAKRRTKRNRTKKRQIYKMIGCAKCHHMKCTCNKKGGAGCGPTGCPIAPFPMKGGNCDVTGCGRILGSYQNGGTCSACGATPVISGGGDFYKPPTPVPGPFVGQKWGPLVNEWPGVDGVGSNRNYSELNTYPSDPQTMMKIRGGRRKRKTQKKIRGGSFMPRDLVNLGRDFTFNLKTAYNALNTIPAPNSPLPFQDQLK